MKREINEYIGKEVISFSFKKKVSFGMEVILMKTTLLNIIKSKLIYCSFFSSYSALSALSELFVSSLDSDDCC